MPLQPAQSNAAAGMQANPSTFQMDLTGAQYKSSYEMRKE